MFQRGEWVADRSGLVGLVDHIEVTADGKPFCIQFGPSGPYRMCAENELRPATEAEVQRKTGER